MKKLVNWVLNRLFLVSEILETRYQKSRSDRESKTREKERLKINVDHQPVPLSLSSFSRVYLLFPKRTDRHKNQVFLLEKKRRQPVICREKKEMIRVKTKI